MTLGWLYLLLYDNTVFGYSLKTGISWLYILCHIRISHYDGFIQGCLNISLVFALRCWTVPYYGTVSYVYYVFLDIPLIWDCHLSCMVLSDHTSVSFIYSLLVHQGTRQGLK